MYEVKKVVKRIIEACNAKQGFIDSPVLEIFLPNELERVDNIRSTKSSIERELRDEEVKYKEKVKTIKKKLAELCDKCPHYSTTYYPDASGNNDSHTECDICGREVDKTTEYRRS